MRVARAGRVVCIAFGLACLTAGAQPADTSPRDPPVTGPDAGRLAAPVAVSRDAQLAYQASREKLLQIRILRRKTNTQSSVGSGFFASADGLVVTNFHVVSQLALEPNRHRGVAVTVDGKDIELELLGFDVRNDLALLRPREAGTAYPALPLRPLANALARGERLYSLGNPLDIGFAVTEGTFNGLVQRSFYPRIFFGGALNPGMSGGPAIDTAGQVIGVNVSKRLDADLVSFLVPVQFVAALIERHGKARPLTTDAHAEVAAQLQAHQAELVQRFTASPFRYETYWGYRVPMPADVLARCWGDGRDRNSKSKLDFERSDCSIDSHVFAGDFNTGNIHVRYEAYDGSRMNALQFAAIYSRSFSNEGFTTRGQRLKTAVECSEQYVQSRGLTLRAVLCLSAYRKLEGLHDLSLLVATVNLPTHGVQARLDATGVSFDNAMKLARLYLDSFSWEARP